MAGIAIGIDCGSAACKGILLKENKIAAYCTMPTSWNSRETAKAVLDELLEQTDSHNTDKVIVATGYGRIGINFANKAVTEITCHARGSDLLLPGVRTVIDIGGQDSKVISMKDGKVLGFQMNDKCAAGTGRFLEMSALRMGVNLTDFPALLNAGMSCPLSSMCAVFADSEIVSLMAAGKTREEVAGGIVQAIVQRVMALLGRIEIVPPILLTGGLAGLDRLRAELEYQLKISVGTVKLSRYAGALGAARIAAQADK